MSFGNKLYVPDEVSVLRLKEVSHQATLKHTETIGTRIGVSTVVLKGKDAI